MSIRQRVTGAGIAEISTGEDELFSEEELEAFENSVGGSFRMPNSASATTAAQQEEEDYDMDDELGHLAESEEVLRQELDSIHVVADPAVMSPRLSSASFLHNRIFNEKEEPVDHDDPRNEKNNTMDFSSILPVGNSMDIFSDDEEDTKIDASKESTGNLHHKVAELTSLLEEFKREMAAAPPRPQDHDYKDEAVRGARQSETSVTSSGIDAFSDEEEAQKDLSDDGIFEPLRDIFSLMFVCNIKSLGMA
jgi:hypothetical protein